MMFELRFATPIEHFGLSTVWVLTSLIIATVLYRWLRDIYTDPLAAFPGPTLAAWTPLYSAAVMWTGEEHLILDRAHAKYGKPQTRN